MSAGLAAEIDAVPPTLVLGIGNLVCGDEGFGVRAVTELARGFRIPPEVRVMDGGTQGLYLLPYVTGCTRLLVLDAIDYGLAPGTLRLIEGDEVPRYAANGKVSVHQTGFQEVLAAAALLGGGPDELVLIGVQAENLDDWGGSLRPSVRAQLEPALARGLEVLRRWGIEPGPRAAPPAGGEGLLGHQLDFAGYERRDGTP